MEYHNEGFLSAQLREQLPFLRPGFVVYMSDNVSYGQIMSRASSDRSIYEALLQSVLDDTV